MPGQPGFRVQQVWAYLAVDPEDDEEGVIGMMTPEGWMPMVATDAQRMSALRPLAQRTAHQLGREIRLVRFDMRTDVEEIR